MPLHIEEKLLNSSAGEAKRKKPSLSGLIFQRGLYLRWSTEEFQMTRRLALAHYAGKSGLTRTLEALPAFFRSRGLLVLNYHRIGSPDDTPFDPGTFSATEEEFDWQVGYLKKHFHIATLDDVLGFLENPRLSKTLLIMLTFDDGYLDNYQLAFPILRRHGASATFFLPTSYIETQPIPWWDSIAWCIKKASEEKKSLQLNYPSREIFSLNKDELPATICRVLKIMKAPAVIPDKFLDGLEEACQSKAPTHAPQRLFLNWAEAKEMIDAGMSIGSHTNKHDILSKLSPEQQLSELVASRQILEKNLGIPIKVLAYPVGAQSAFNKDSMVAAHSAGYHAGFSFYGGINLSNRSINKYDIKREPISPDVTRQLFRLRYNIASITGNVYV